MRYIYFIIVLPGLIFCSCTGKTDKDNRLIFQVDRKSCTTVSVPFGMVQVYPLMIKSSNTVRFNGFGNIPGNVSAIDLLVFPYMNAITESIKNPFFSGILIPDYDSKSEVSNPGYYMLQSGGEKFKTEVTTTARTAFYKFSLPKDTTVSILLNFSYNNETETGDHDVSFRCTNNSLVTGSYVIKEHTVKQLFFAAQFSKPFRKSGFIEDGKVIAPSNSCLSKKSTVLFLSFSTKYEQVFKVKIGFSTASPEGAMENMKREINGWTFENYQAGAELLWENELNRISIETSDEKLKSEFYTRLFECLHFPALLSDYYCQYLSPEGLVNKSEGFMFYDVKKILIDPNQLMLLDIFQPGEMGDFFQSLGLNKPEEADSVPLIIAPFPGLESFPSGEFNSNAGMILQTAGLVPVYDSVPSFRLIRPASGKVSFKIRSGKVFSVLNRNIKEKKAGIKKVILNGQKLEKPEITLHQIFKGGILEIY